MSHRELQDKNETDKDHNRTEEEESTSVSTTLSGSHSIPIPFVSFIVTGFGPFGGVPDNPTSIIVNGMKEYLASSEENSTSNSNNWKKELLPHLQHCLVLETSAHAVQEAFRDDDDNDANGTSPVGGGGGEIAKLVRENLTNTTETKQITITVLLHLGVNYQGTQIQLEECSYNDATFRIPDQRGYKPYKETIHVHCSKRGGVISSAPPPPFGSCCKTSINVHQLCHDLNENINNNSNNNSLVAEAATTARNANLRGGGRASAAAVYDGNTTACNKPSSSNNNTIVTVSTDPGRFVCNVLIYTSLSKYQHTTTTFNTSNSDASNNSHEDKNDNGSSSSLSKSQPQPVQKLVHSLFVHVPPFNTTKYNCGKEEQFHYIAMIMDKLKSCKYFS